MINESLNRCFELPFDELYPLFDDAYRISRVRFSDQIFFYAPGFIHYDTPFYRAVNKWRFPSVSVTGTGCQLQCEHCKGKLLETMIPATTPEMLREVCTRIMDKGGKGLLVSGGATSDGGVPLQKFVPAMGWAKEELGLDIVVHTGLVEPVLAEALADINIDAVMLDIIGSEKTISRIYHMDLTVEAYDQSLYILEEHDIPIVPHVVVGLHYGRLEGERRALEILSGHNLAAVVVVAFMPLEGTPMDDITPSSPEEITRVVLASRLAMPEIPIILGCARPRGEHKARTDVLAIKAGVNGIAYPSEKGYNHARERGLGIRFSDECCSLLFRDIMASIGGH
ncbi:radical SAM protein [Candidatus Bathyarchaeota archaeon]|jgi:hypothetical protein|nr:radical SAM protein [Candidatus Bathyarchaeota archaeon]MDP6048446.1 radical SAM protein [Candidatus Bathyarchaeota archaeon]MDP7443633.1 radical SAM protein [Candidatus Bathyarchaeota archaeon]|tara:strand:- start:1265 stop:2281 length:1017 start_codon:yes stop_codon:yes gene_type:complete